MRPSEVVLGTRGSALAVRQTDLVRAALAALAPELTVVVRRIMTHGDRVRRVPLAGLGGAGVFVKELETALLSGGIDLAVHSMKDLPTEMPEGLTIAAVPEREDARDVLVARSAASFRDLPPGARIGTGSPRRRAQVLHLRPDLDVRDIRGNLDTRLRRLDERRYDAIILAAAGLRRLGLADRITEPFPFEAMLPAVGQGALALQIRTADADLRDIVGRLTHAATAAAVTAERAFLKRLKGGCHVPAGAHAGVTEQGLEIDGCIASPDGRQLLRGRRTGDPNDAESVGAGLADDLLERGGRAILKAAEPV